MSAPDDLLAAFGQARTPTDASLRRASERLRLGTEEEAAMALLRALPDPDGAALGRLRARVRASIRELAAGSRAPGLRWGLLGAGLATASLFAAALFLPDALVPEPARTVVATLESAEPAVSAPAPGVTLTATGWGFVTGTEREPTIQWGAGSLRVEVDPRAGIDLRVETPSGAVRVLGTIFTVDVSDLGTQVMVERGRVEVACALAATQILTAGGETTCVRASAANLLNLAIASRSRGGPDGRVLGLAEQGLAVQEEDGPVRDELRLVRFQTLLSLGRTGDARAAADDYLVRASAGRRSDVLRTAAKLAFSDGGCPLGAPYLRDLRATGAAQADDLVPLARCLMGQEPEIARAVLDEAAALGPSDEVALRIESLRAQLAP